MNKTNKTKNGSASRKSKSDTSSKATGIKGSININPEIHTTVGKSKEEPLKNNISTEFRFPSAELPEPLFWSSIPNTIFLTIHITNACSQNITLIVRKLNEEEILFRIPVGGSLILLESDVHTLSIACREGEEECFCSGTLNGNIEF
ncbi:S-Ena type endospore appendage [Alteribacillus sp. YIM 98480]|uniref:S-Ena type endospore appendage n=1 Tax=Alteribacillus sp. YIM 98480 TaxID=2606599 RepID=UPI00131AC0B6|nr:S-Ena type endospore appendage [Alteribacillus sp. YIM 98480]